MCFITSDEVILLKKKEDEPVEATSEPSLSQFETLVARKVFLWDSIKDSREHAYDYSFRQTAEFKEIEAIDAELIKIEAQKEVV